ncbi:VanZ family protein [Limosilactobacillus sp.]|uniref:VanZ family protein n=1 Tax=Limosilactobacillus sp. TaxID=2773925 RepID=UPI0025C5AE01|nr:VanZ family protein [Limosilactobacillus sp.]MCH3923150.1 VanZ family protein [Limosilactobacillus sp.]MCH3927833.1 VanZ family protein [Limosilactobacillus sp.]
MRSWIPFTTYFLLTLVLFWYWPARQRCRTAGQRVTIVTFLIYLVAIYWLCLTPAQFSFPSAPKILFYFHGVPFNAVPFQGLSPEFFLNIVMTFPLGVYLFLINPQRRFEGAIGWGLLFSLFIESNQFVCDWLFNLQRLADIDDLITNTLGAIIGFALMILLDQNGGHKFLHYFVLK